MPRALLLVLALLLAAFGGCAREKRPAAKPPRSPGEIEVEEAAEELAARVRRLYPGGGWPPHLPRSHDFPALPLVRLDPPRDPSGTGADLEAMRALLEEAIRRERLLRLEADELAVPPSLREEEGGWPGPAAESAGLVLRMWIDGARRVRLSLEDQVRGEVLVVARSRGL
jgi:hypothetical protein